MLKKSLWTGIVALGLAWAVPASAATVVSFDPTGGGSTALKIDAVQELTGNTIVLGASANSKVGDIVTALYQANVGSATLGGATQYSSPSPAGSPGNYFTLVAGFKEVVLSTTGGSFPTVVLGLIGSAPSFFDLYHNGSATTGAPGNDDTGLGFITGAPVLSGHFINTPTPGDGLSNTTFTGCCLPIDGFNGDDTTPSLTSIGAFTTSALITGVNAGFFPDLKANMTISIVTSELDLNYIHVDPADCFSNDGVTSCNQVGIGSIGATNGLGTNTMFETHASESFAPVPTVPEPATLSLLGIGLAVSGLRKRAKRNRQ
jgi:hypothetical protein